MGRLNPDHLHVRHMLDSERPHQSAPRRYTLTHSDRTGELFLTIGPDYDHRQIGNLYTVLMRDEVLAEWTGLESTPALHLTCHVSGGLALGPAGWRYRIFQRELPLVLECFRHGDAGLFETHPHLDQAPIWVHFTAIQRRYQRMEYWGVPADYRLTPASGRPPVTQ